MSITFQRWPELISPIFGTILGTHNLRLSKNGKLYTYIITEADARVILMFHLRLERVESFFSTITTMMKENPMYKHHRHPISHRQHSHMQAFESIFVSSEIRTRNVAMWEARCQDAQRFIHWIHSSLPKQDFCCNLHFNIKSWKKHIIWWCCFGLFKCTGFYQRSSWRVSYAEQGGGITFLDRFLLVNEINVLPFCSLSCFVHGHRVLCLWYWFYSFF